jgi:hypothetical protein
MSHSGTVSDAICLLTEWLGFQFVIIVIPIQIQPRKMIGSSKSETFRLEDTETCIKLEKFGFNIVAKSYHESSK